MADQCIVCLEDLDAVPDASILRDAGLSTTEDETTHPGILDNEQKVALIKPCGHVLHDECLREWSQKANSCPICRHTFNLVEVLDKVGGKFPLSSHIFWVAQYSLRIIACSAMCFLGSWG
jgi:hypothetical protein